MPAPTPEERRLREQMVAQIAAYGIKDERLLEAFRQVRRHRFLPAPISLAQAYGDHPIPIGEGQTISQPYIVAYMTAAISPQPGDRVLDLGTGSGYQAAILAELGCEVYSLEVVPELLERARLVLETEGYRVETRLGDARQGWPEQAPYDGMIAACATAEVPDPLLAQLAEGGTLILPVGEHHQQLERYRKVEGEPHRQVELPVRFVPMV